MTEPRSPLMDPHTRRLLIGWGLLVWATVAVAIRLVGDSLLSPTAPLVVVGFFVATIPLMATVTYPVYRFLSIPTVSRPRAAAIMSIPGLVLDVLLVTQAEVVFPAMSPGAVINFGGILLFGYAVVLVTGVWPASGS